MDKQGFPRPVVTGTAQFRRIEDHDMTLGKIVIYQLDVTGFTIVMHRDGVAFRGSMPVLKRQGMDSFKKVMDRAVIHHEHLRKGWEAGIGQQTILTETEVDAVLNPAASPIVQV